MFTENSDTFIKWFRRFHETRIKWAIIDSDIYNMDESGNAISVKQKLKIVNKKWKNTGPKKKKKKKNLNLN